MTQRKKIQTAVIAVMISTLGLLGGCSTTGTARTDDKAMTQEMAKSAQRAEQAAVRAEQAAVRAEQAAARTEQAVDRAARMAEKADRIFQKKLKK